jgi:hypothetical protein
LPSGVDPAFPIIETQPVVDASYLAPFDRADGIGWHNDFSTHSERPEVSLAYLARVDPLGAEHGAWRVASCKRVLEQLLQMPEGSEIAQFLSSTNLPYSFTGDGEPAFFPALEPRDAGRPGLRFYGRAMRDGARLAYGRVPAQIERAIEAIESAADQVGRVLAAPTGSMLIVDNWHALHDRLPQTVKSNLPPRRSLLCFVERVWGHGKSPPFD